MASTTSLPEQAFLYVGTIEEAVEKAKELEVQVIPVKIVDPGKGRLAGRRQPGRLRHR
jgi:hypothetical protein